jgi:hypothetical protein
MRTVSTIGFEYVGDPERVYLVNLHEHLFTYFGLGAEAAKHHMHSRKRPFVCLLENVQVIRSHYFNSACQMTPFLQLSSDHTNYPTPSVVFSECLD